jgi:hypothetical protein
MEKPLEGSFSGKIPDLDANCVAESGYRQSSGPDGSRSMRRPLAA